MTNEEKLQQLLDYKEIIELKARFGRLADVKDWDAFKEVFSEDATFDLGTGDLLHGGEAYANAVRDMLEDATSIHRFLMPEITFVSATEATGIWMLNDYVEWQPDPSTGERVGFKGYAREYETYRKIDGIWKITSWRLRYDRFDPLAREPLPRRVEGGGPDALRDEAYMSAVVNPRGT
jgi:hypothetical protein